MVGIELAPHQFFKPLTIASKDEFGDGWYLVSLQIAILFFTSFIVIIIVGGGGSPQPLFYFLLIFLCSFPADGDGGGGERKEKRCPPVPHWLVPNHRAPERPCVCIALHWLLDCVVPFAPARLQKDNSPPSTCTFSFRELQS